MSTLREDDGTLDSMEFGPHTWIDRSYEQTNIDLLDPYVRALLVLAVQFPGPVGLVMLDVDPESLFELSETVETFAVLICEQDCERSVRVSRCPEVVRRMEWATRIPLDISPEQALARTEQLTALIAGRVAARRAATKRGGG